MQRRIEVANQSYARTDRKQHLNRRKLIEVKKGGDHQQQQRSDDASKRGSDDGRWSCLRPGGLREAVVSGSAVRRTGDMH